MPSLPFWLQASVSRRHVVISDCFGIVLTLILLVMCYESICEGAACALMGMWPCLNHFQWGRKPRPAINAPTRRNDVIENSPAQTARPKVVHVLTSGNRLLQTGHHLQPWKLHRALARRMSLFLARRPTMTLQTISTSPYRFLCHIRRTRIGWTWTGTPNFHCRYQRILLFITRFTAKM
jgi:hypothetical protein